MKTYKIYTEKERQEIIRRKREELQLFQHLLRTYPQLNDRFHGKAFEIADGLQPWIEALELSLKE